MGSDTGRVRERLALTLAIATGMHLLLLVALPHFPAMARQEVKTVRVSLGSTHREPGLTPPLPVMETAKPLKNDPDMDNWDKEPPESPTPVKATSSDIPAVAEKPPASSTENDGNRQHNDSETATRSQGPPLQRSAQSARRSDQNKKHHQESTAPHRPELSPYELALRRAIARELRYTSSMSELESPRRLMLEIELMDNGILQRASVTETSGDDRLDYQARQAALVASPFPAVPEDQQERRFTVELRFTPPSLSREGRERQDWNGG